MNVSYAMIKQKFPNLFCVDNLRQTYKANNDEITMSFVDFLMYAEDYYLIKYAGKLSKTAWWLFSLIKGLVRRDGFVKLSYKDVMDYFCVEGNESNKISKPTFFKYIDELESFGLIERYANKKLFSTNYQNDTNTYVVISQVDEIVEICKNVTDAESFRRLVLNVQDKPQKAKPAKKGKAQKQDNKVVFEEAKEYYRECWATLDDFFDFLGEKNKTGNISISRKAKILTALQDMNAYIDDIEYAVSQTIKRGIRSEKYFLKIIKNIIEENESGNAQEKSAIQSKYVNRDPGREQMSEERYIKERHYMLVDIGYYQYIVAEFKNVDERDMNEYERKLYKAALVLEHKSKCHDKGAEKAIDRSELLWDKYGIHEQQRIERNHDRSLIWYYDKEKTKRVPLSVIKKIKAENKNLFKMYKYMYPDRRYYDGL